MVVHCFYEKEEWSLWALCSGPCLPLQLFLFHVAPAYSPAPTTLALLQLMDTTGLLHMLTLQSGMISHLPLPIVNSYRLFRSQLLREAPLCPFHWFCVLLVPYTSPPSPITVTILYPFVWSYDWCFSPLLDSELDKDRSCLNCGPSLYSKLFLQFLAKKRDSP